MCAHPASFLGAGRALGQNVKYGAVERLKLKQVGSLDSKKLLR